MKIRDVARAYLKSPLSAVSAGICLLAGAVGVSILYGNFLLGLGCGAVIWAAFSVVVVQTRLGAQAVVSVLDLDAVRKTQEAIVEASRNRDRLARLRLPDPEVAKTAEYLTLASGEYLEACQKTLSHSPEADARIADSVDIVDLYLKEMDEASTEKRYGLPDADPFADAKARVGKALSENARIIREERIRIDGGLPPESLMRAKEELQ